MSIRNLIGSGLNSAHPSLDERWIARSAIMRGRYVFNVHVYCLSGDVSVANGIYTRGECHAMILVSWIGTFIFIMGVIVQMMPMKWCNNILTNKSC